MRYFNSQNAKCPGGLWESWKLVFSHTCYKGTANPALIALISILSADIWNFWMEMSIYLYNTELCYITFLNLEVPKRNVEM